MTSISTRRIRSDRGAAMVEAVFTIPLMLALSFSVFEFGRAFHTWQVMSNAAREGARMATLPETDDAMTVTRVKNYLTDGQLGAAASATVDVVHNNVIEIAAGATASASTVTVTYPFEFVALQPVMSLLVPGTAVGEPINMTVASTMRNETP